MFGREKRRLPTAKSCRNILPSTLVALEPSETFKTLENKYTESYFTAESPNRNMRVFWDHKRARVYRI